MGGGARGGHRPTCEVAKRQDMVLVVESTVQLRRSPLPTPLDARQPYLVLLLERELKRWRHWPWRYNQAVKRLI